MNKKPKLLGTGYVRCEFTPVLSLLLKNKPSSSILDPFVSGNPVCFNSGADSEHIYAAQTMLAISSRNNSNTIQDVKI